MFTGIVEARGTVESLEANGAVYRAVFAARDLPVGELPLGASIAVDGVCLTVTGRGPGWFAADLGPETLARTTLAALVPGGRVHLERPLKLGDALGGHLVSGHVDGVGQLVGRREQGGALELEIAAPAALASTLVVKGSITVDGVSLTLNAVNGDRFSVTLIPHTLAVTGLGDKAVGASVNLEGDLIAKHIERMVAARLAAAAAPPAPPTEAAAAPALPGATDAPPPTSRRPAPSGLTLETLRKHGFVR
jgi:riboflavin synthase